MAPFNKFEPARKVTGPMYDRSITEMHRAMAPANDVRRAPAPAATPA